MAVLLRTLLTKTPTSMKASSKVNSAVATEKIEARLRASRSFGTPIEKFIANSSLALPAKTPRISILVLLSGSSFATVQTFCPATGPGTERLKSKPAG